MLARLLADAGRYEQEAAKKAYIYWLESMPFDIGNTVFSGLRGQHNRTSQANGGLMRISPLGIFGARHDLDEVAEWARQDAAITHVHPICQQANALYAMAIADAVREGVDGQSLYERIVIWARELETEEHSWMPSMTQPKRRPPILLSYRAGF